MKIILGALATMASISGAPVTPPPDALVSYVVRPNDNLYTLARRYFLHLSDYRTVQALNHVQNPYHLRIASTLMIPRVLLKATPIRAKLIAFRGAVTVAGEPAALDAPVEMGARLTTGSNAFASIELPDGSTLTLPSQSAIRVTSLQRYLINGAIERRFDLEAGRTQSIVTPISNPRGTYKISTPLSVSAVRGTNFRVTYDPTSNASTSEVIEGHVAVNAAKDHGGPLLAAGEGVRVSSTGVGTPVPLLKPPALMRPSRIQDNLGLAFDIDPMSGAAGYRVQLSAEAGFLDILAEQTVKAPRAEFPGRPNGTYFIRVSAIDQYGIEGLPKIYSFQRRLNALNASAERLGPRRYLFRWRANGDGHTSFRFRLLHGSEAGVPVIDRPGVPGGEIVISDLQPGDYYWQISSTQLDAGEVYERATPFQKFVIAPDQTSKLRGTSPNSR